MMLNNWEILLPQLLIASPTRSISTYLITLPKHWEKKLFLWTGSANIELKKRGMNSNHILALPISNCRILLKKLWSVHVCNHQIL